MVELITIRSVSFDTSFLLKDTSFIDQVINKLTRDAIVCFITSTVVSELEQLWIWKRVTPLTYKRAIKRWKRSQAIVIDFRNRLLSDAFGRACMLSMEKHHGISAKDIVNDCRILVSTLQKGVDLFLSEDFHFTSEITKEVIDEVSNVACSEYHQMCDSMLYSVDAKTFLEAYKNNGIIDINIIQRRMKAIRKNKKYLGHTEI